MTRFYLGTHQDSWLKSARVPLFVSHRRLRSRVRLPRAVTDWALDSGGFTELSMHGAWTVTPEEYARAVQRYGQEVGRLDWAAPQDWMCEPWITAKTGLTVLEHQHRTVASVLELRSLVTGVNVIPVLQGRFLSDYEHCAQLYLDAGVDLASEPVVGLGSVCRRQATREIAEIAETFSALGYQLHGFGVKTLGLNSYAEHLASADSMAWSIDARYSEPIAGHPHKNCANCPEWAYRWYHRIVNQHLGGIGV